IISGIVRIGTLGEDGKRVTIEILKGGGGLRRARRHRSEAANRGCWCAEPDEDRRNPRARIPRLAQPLAWPRLDAAAPNDPAAAPVLYAFRGCEAHELGALLRPTGTLSHASGCRRRPAGPDLFAAAPGRAGQSPWTTPRSIINILNKWRSDGLVEFD